MNASEIHATADRQSALDRDDPAAVIRDLTARVDELEARLRRVSRDAEWRGGVFGSSVFIATTDGTGTQYVQATPTFSGTNLTMTTLRDFPAGFQNGVARAALRADVDDLAAVQVPRFCIPLIEFDMGTARQYVRFPQTIQGLPNGASAAGTEMIDRTFITVDGAQNALVVNGSSTFLGSGLSIGWNVGTNEAVLRTDGTGNVFFGPPVFTAN